MNNGVFKMIVAVGWNLESNSCTNAEGKNQSNKSNCDSRKLFETTEKYVSGYLQKNQV